MGQYWEYMQRVHLRDSVDLFGGEKYLLADHLRELYLDFEGLEIVLSDTLDDDEKSLYSGSPYTNETDQTFFIPFENVRAFDSVDDEFNGGTIGTNKGVEFRDNLQMFGGSTRVDADEIIERPPGVKVVRDEIEVIVPQGNISTIEVDDGALHQT